MLRMIPEGNPIQRKTDAIASLVFLCPDLNLKRAWVGLAHKKNRNIKFRFSFAEKEGFEPPEV